MQLPQESLNYSSVSFSLQRIIQDRKVCQRDTIFPVQSSLQNEIADMRILGQERPMKICAYNVSIEDAFTGVLFIVSVAMKNFAERHVAADISPSAVVFKADDLVRQRVLSSTG